MASLGPESMDEDELEVITWKVLPGASQRKKDLLVENQGFSYTIKRKRGSSCVQESPELGTKGI